MNIIIDANLLIVLVVGLYNRAWVGTHKRTRAYTPEDFDLLVAMLGRFQRVIISAHTLAEASNLLGQDGDSRTVHLRQILSQLVGMYDEVHTLGRDLIKDSRFLRLGVSDCGMLAALDQKTILITSDLALYLAAIENYPNCLNFTHVRVANTTLI